MSNSVSSYELRLLRLTRLTRLNSSTGDATIMKHQNQGNRLEKNIHWLRQWVNGNEQDHTCLSSIVYQDKYCSRGTIC
jgi:hypothetical protein